MSTRSSAMSARMRLANCCLVMRLSSGGPGWCSIPSENKTSLMHLGSVVWHFMRHDVNRRLIPRMHSDQGFMYIGQVPLARTPFFSSTVHCMGFPIMRWHVFRPPVSRRAPRPIFREQSASVDFNVPTPFPLHVLARCLLKVSVSRSSPLSSSHFPSTATFSKS